MLVGLKFGGQQVLALSDNRPIRDRWGSDVTDWILMLVYLKKKTNKKKTPLVVALVRPLNRSPPRTAPLVGTTS